MPTPSADGEHPGVGAAVKQVAEHASALARLEMELAGLELKRKIANLGAGVGLGIGAGVFGLFALGFGLAAAAAGFATFLATWLAILIVFGILLVLTLILGLLALSRVKKGSPPVPEQAIAEAKMTTAALKSNGT